MMASFRDQFFGSVPGLAPLEVPTSSPLAVALTVGRQCGLGQSADGKDAPRAGETP